MQNIVAEREMESNSVNNDTRKMMDTLVAGYLGRQKYWESLKCLMNESSILRAAHCGGMSIILGDTVHGKHLEEIIILFSEYGHFGLNPGLLDFGVRLRSLANEFTFLTNAGVHWSDAQKLLYGKHSAPSRHCSQQSSSVTTSEYNICETNHNMLPAVNADSTTSISSHHSNGSASTRRKCTQPVSINTRRREFMKEVVEPVVHTAQQIIDNGNGSITDPNSSLSALSVITIDENAVGTLDRCMAHENFAELIESIEKDFPDGFFDSFPNSDNTESLNEAVFDAVSSQSNEAQQEHEQRENDIQNLYNIPHSMTEESKPLCSSTPTKFKTQEKFSSVLECSSSKTPQTLENYRMQPKSRKKPVVAESAIFRDRVEIECPHLPDERTKKVDVARDLFLSSKNFMESCDDSFSKTNTGKLEISAGWRKLAELCEETNKKAVDNEEQKKTQRRESLETCQLADRNLREKEVKCPPSSADLEIREKVRNEFCNHISADSNVDVTAHHTEECVEDEGNAHNAKLNPKSFTEEEIELLFENSDHQDCETMRTQEDDERKNSSPARAAPTREYRKGSEDRDDISGDEGLNIAYCERQASVKIVTDKKKRKQHKQKLASSDIHGDFKIKKKADMYVNIPIRDTQGHASAAAAAAAAAAGSSPLHKITEQCKKRERFNKFEENRDEIRIDAEKRKREKEFVMKKEREEIERQKREVEEKEFKRAAERERKRKEEKEREAREKEQRERRRKERENREKLKNVKDAEDKLSSSCELRKHREGFKDGKPKKDKSALQFDSRSDEANEASILDRLFGDDDNFKPLTKISDKEEAKRKSEESRTRSSFNQKIIGKIKFAKEDCRATREKPERSSDNKITKCTKEGASSRADALDDFFNPIAKPGTSRKDETNISESRSCKIVVSGVNKGRENLLVGGGHSARVGMVLEKATRIRTKYEHEEKLKQDYRKMEGIRRTSYLDHNTRKRIQDLPIPKTPDILSQLLKSDSSVHNDALRRSVSAKNINCCSEASALTATSSKIPAPSKSTTSIYCSFSGSSGSKSLQHNEPSDTGFPSNQIKKPRLDMTTIDAVLQSLHGLDKGSPSSSFSFPTAS